MNQGTGRRLNQWRYIPHSGPGSGQDPLLRVMSDACVYTCVCPTVRALWKWCVLHTSVHTSVALACALTTRNHPTNPTGFGWNMTLEKKSLFVCDTPYIKHTTRIFTWPARKFKRTSRNISDHRPTLHPLGLCNEHITDQPYGSYEYINIQITHTTVVQAYIS